MKEKFKRYKEIFLKYKIIYGKLFLVLIIIFIFLIFINIFIFINNKNLSVTFFDVGQGDSIFIKIPSGENILVDAGPDNLILNRIDDQFSIFESSIDLAILSHPDSDHITGFISIFKDYKVLNVLENGDHSKDSSVYDETIVKINQEKEINNSNTFTASCGDKISFKDKDINIYILYPVQNDLSTFETNDNSIVFLLTYKKYSFLFTGDTTKEAEKKILFNIDKCFDNQDSKTINEYLKNLTVLKVSHHGSNTASSEEFLKTIKPIYSIISAGENNRYGHPTIDTLNILKRYSKYILNTIDDGSITFTTNGEDLNISKTK